MVIIGVRKNSRWEYYGCKFKEYNYYEVLVGRVWESSDKTRHQIEVYSWYCYNRYNMAIECRGDRKAIRNCMKRQPDKIKWHTGRKIDIYSFNVRVLKSNGNNWKEYQQLL